MASELHKIIDWVKKNGEVKAIDRLRVMVLPFTMADGLQLAAVTPNSSCSPKTLAAVRQAAGTVVGSACPF